MKRWKRRRVEEVEVEPKGFEEDEFEEEEFAPASRHFQDYFEDEDPGMPEAEWRELEAKLRAGNYVHKRSDPWTLHVLYSNLKELGDL